MTPAADEAAVGHTVRVRDKVDDANASKDEAALEADAAQVVMPSEPEEEPDLARSAPSVSCADQAAIGGASALAGHFETLEGTSLAVDEVACGQARASSSLHGEPVKIEVEGKIVELTKDTLDWNDLDSARAILGKVQKDSPAPLTFVLAATV